MSLSCECGYDDYEWFYVIEDNWRIAQTDFKCYGCCKPGKDGDKVRLLVEQSYPEEEDYENDEPVTTGYKRICEECCDLYDSLIELGFCMSADWGFIRDAHEEYKHEYVRRKA